MGQAKNRAAQINELKSTPKLANFVILRPAIGDCIEDTLSVEAVREKVDFIMKNVSSMGWQDPQCAWVKDFAVMRAVATQTGQTPIFGILFNDDDKSIQPFCFAVATEEQRASTLRSIVANYKDHAEGATLLVKA